MQTVSIRRRKLKKKKKKKKNVLKKWQLVSIIKGKYFIGKYNKI